MAGGSEMKDLYVNVFTIGKYFVNIVYFPKIVRKALLCLQKIHDVHFFKALHTSLTRTTLTLCFSSQNHISKTVFHTVTFCRDTVLYIL